MNTQRILGISLVASLLASSVWAQQCTPPKTAAATALKANQEVANIESLDPCFNIITPSSDIRRRLTP